MSLSSQRYLAFEGYLLPINLSLLPSYSICSHSNFIVFHRSSIFLAKTIFIGTKRCSRF